MFYLAYAPSPEKLTGNAVKLGLSRYNLLEICEEQFSDIAGEIGKENVLDGSMSRDGKSYALMPMRPIIFGEGTRRRCTGTIQYFDYPLTTVGEWLVAARLLLETQKEARQRFKVEMRKYLEKEVAAAMADLERAVSDKTFRQSPYYGKFLLTMAREAGVDMTKYDALLASCSWVV